MKGNTLPDTNEQLQRELAESKKPEQELLDLRVPQSLLTPAPLEDKLRLITDYSEMHIPDRD